MKVYYAVALAEQYSLNHAGFVESYGWAVSHPLQEVVVVSCE